MNILYIDAGNVVADSYMYRYYGALYRELKELAAVSLYQGVVYDINTVLAQFDKVDGIIFGLGYFSKLPVSAYRKIVGLDTLNIPVICMLHKPQTNLAYKLNFCKKNNIDVLADAHITYKKYGELLGVKAIRSWFTATPAIFHPRDVAIEYDLGFIGASHGEGKIEGETRDLRDRTRAVLVENDFNIFWKKHNTPHDRIASVEEYATHINKCKMWLSTTGPLEDVGPRYFEVMLSRTLLLCNEMPTSYEGVFQDGVNCVMFKNDLSNLKDKVEYYLEHEDERSQIAGAGYQMVINNYTWKHMALNLLDNL